MTTDRLTSKDRALAMSDFAVLLLASKTASDYCRGHVLHPRIGLDVIGTELFILNQDATLRSLAHFGQPPFPDLQKISLWDTNLIAEAARTCSITIGTTRDPNTGKEVFIFCYPAATPSQSVGITVVVRSSNSPIVLSDEDQTTMNLMSALWFETLGVPSLREKSGSRDDDPSALTQRQVDIIQQMVAGKTNAQIAQEQIVSESTIRQETVRIYRSLSVGGRTEAVQRALHLGIVSRAAK